MLDGAPVAAAADALRVRLEDVVVARSGRRLIDRLDLDVPRSGVTALMGPNGAGKSLTLRLVAGLVAPDAGRVLWDGAPRPPRGRIGIVFQRPVLLRRSVEGNLRHALALARVPRRERRARLDALLAVGRLGALARSPARALSGGEQQRLALVRALAFRPSLLLLDEPTASLEPRAAAAIEALVARVAGDGTAVVLVTHDAGQARRLADRALFLHDGRIVEDAPAPRFFQAPESTAAQAYLGGRLLI